MNYYDYELVNTDSDYLTVSDYNLLMTENYKHSLSILNYNIRSFNANKDSLIGLFETPESHPDIIVLT